MNCNDFRDFIIESVGFELRKEDELRLREHLEICKECRLEHQEFLALTQLMKQIPQVDSGEKWTLRQLIRRDQRWRSIVFSKAALWLITLTAFLTVLSVLPVRAELSSAGLSVRWGNEPTREEVMASELQTLRAQLESLQKQNQEFHNVSEKRMKQFVEQSSLEQEKRYWQTLEMFSNYFQVQRKADLRKIQHQIATTYDQTGQEVERTNELLQYVLKASASPGVSVYEEN